MLQTTLDSYGCAPAMLRAKRQKNGSKVTTLRLASPQKLLLPKDLSDKRKKDTCAPNATLKVRHLWKKTHETRRAHPPPKRSERERMKPLFTSFRVAIEREANDLEKNPHRCCKLHSTPMAVLRRCYGLNDRKTAVK